jgi:hypothetical protein|tara:strand:+ start:236 stop:439 length:204 start_codon:yes stop_codon:yes gene_type:complete
MMSRDKYTLPSGGVEVLLMALEVFEKYGYKYPSIVKEHHYVIAKSIQQNLLLRSTDGEAKDEGTADA